MGGMLGMGPIAPEAGEAVFHERWEGRVLALTRAAGALRRWNLDMARHARERIPGPAYLAMSYYQKWLAGLETQLVESGLVTPDELARGAPAPGSAKSKPPLTADQVRRQSARRGPSERKIDAPPSFAIGQAVRARNIHPIGHTRLPRYVRGRLGEIARHYGAHVFPDSNAHSRGEDPRHLYTVRFSARELWGADAREGDSVSLDLWEPYLERA